MNPAGVTRGEAAGRIAARRPPPAALLEACVARITGRNNALGAGLRLSVQQVAPMRREARLLRAAHAFERAQPRQGLAPPF